jgi:RNA polymerase sigma-70 factor (ECF subfamily)
MTTAGMPRRIHGSWQAAPHGPSDEMTTASPSNIDDSDDSDLVVRARRGDRIAFEALVRLHADRLHSVVRRLVDDPHEAEEVTQEAFLRAWRSISNFHGDSQFFTWLYRIGVNEAHRRTARRTAKGRVASLDEQLTEPADPRPGPDRTAEHSDLRRALEHAIRDLPADQRAPLVLRDVEGLSTSEAAAILGLGEAAFKSRLHRARLIVRKAVRDYLPEEGQP